MTDIITLGELLIDLTQSGCDENGNGVFTAYPGGAPANVAVAASRLGAKTAFIGKVGDDAFGRSLRSVLEKEGVNTDGLYTCEAHPTTMAIVTVDESGERDFSFYRDPGADTQLTVEEAVKAIDMPAVGKKTILHVGSLSMTDHSSREACEAALKRAGEKGMLVSYDPNYREALWHDRDEAVEQMKRLLPYADILKVSDEEMEMLAGTDDLKKGSYRLMTMMSDPDAASIEAMEGGGIRQKGMCLVMVTLGADGVFVRAGIATAKLPGFKVRVADTNGAGDTFLGAMLTQMSKKINGSPDEAVDLGWSELLEMVKMANKAASITCTRHGAIPAMPSAEEIAL